MAHEQGMAHPNGELCASSAAVVTCTRNNCVCNQLLRLLFPVISLYSFDRAYVYGASAGVCAGKSFNGACFRKSSVDTLFAAAKPFLVLNKA
ncbi:hypothetical protein RchiOBHm_Chr4g0393801 [Rosa chinensis]|uniref:Uncharacterized protein n=1 Tax=Rosa chinensis TaxID=74649 RepID=A0A2P6QR26_ROSCH|nr:hypothetical protein RchiOBHm_Chr4g0393801 [Rosa chinensis]